MEMVEKMMSSFILMTVVVSLAVGVQSWRREEDCHFMCECETSPKHETHVTCRGDGLGLNYVPSLPRTTARLDMSHNNLRHITQDTFTNDNAPRVRMLKMSYCSIAIIDENAFENSSFEKHVTHLDLSHNALTDTKTLIIFLKRFKELIYLDVTQNPGINCLELKRELGHNVRTIQCDAPRISYETKTTEVTPPDTTPMIRLNHTSSDVPVEGNSSDDTTPSPVVDTSNPTSPDTQTPTPVTNAGEGRKRNIEESFCFGCYHTLVVILIVIVCVAVIACILLFLMVRKLSTQLTSLTDDLEGGLRQDLINQDFYENMASINE